MILLCFAILLSLCLLALFLLPKKERHRSVGRDKPSVTIHQRVAQRLTHCHGRAEGEGDQLHEMNICPIDDILT